MVKVLVVDDSSFMRKALTHIIEADDALTVVGTAGDGEDAVQKVMALEPDVALLDIDMPVMDGFATLLRLMGEHPIPVVMMSGLDSRHANIAIKSLEYGAVDFIAKPSGVISYDIEEIRDQIVQKLKVAAGVTVQRGVGGLPAPRIGIPVPLPSFREPKIVVVGASTGGLVAIATVLSGLGRDLPATVLVVQHLAPEFIPAFVDRLKWATHLDVSIAEKDEPLEGGRVLVAPGGRYTVVEGSTGKNRIAFKEAGDAPPFPSIDMAMVSAANAYGKEAVGVILTGLGNDGVDGMRAIKAAGGKTIAQDRATCVVYGMPKAAIEAGHIDEAIPLPRIADAITWAVIEGEKARRAGPSLFLKEFLDDTHDGLRRIHAALPLLEEDPRRREPLEEIRKVFHTLKGSSETIGFEEMAFLARRGMGLAAGMGKGKYPPTPEAVAILKEITAILEAMVGEKERGGTGAGWYGRLEELRLKIEALTDRKRMGGKCG